MRNKIFFLCISFYLSVCIFIYLLFLNRAVVAPESAQRTPVVVKKRQMSVQKIVGANRQSVPTGVR